MKNEYDIFYNNKKEIIKNHQKYKEKFTQIGGVFPEKKYVSYDDNKYVLIYEQDDKFHLYMLYDDSKKNKCITIIIDQDEKNAIIENLSGDFRDCPKGSKLLQIAIKFLKENKKEFNIKTITLTDMATKACFGKSIIFADMFTLLYGQTWYMKHGFLPHDTFNNILNEKQLEKAKKNKEIMEKAKISDIPQLTNYIKKYGSDDFDAGKLVEKIKKIPNCRVTSFLKWLLKSYNTHSCTLFYNIYQKIMRDLDVKTLYGTSFFMKI